MGVKSKVINFKRMLRSTENFASSIKQLATLTDHSTLIVEDKNGSLLRIYMSKFRIYLNELNTQWNQLHQERECNSGTVEGNDFDVSLSAEWLKECRKRIESLEQIETLIPCLPEESNRIEGVASDSVLKFLNSKTAYDQTKGQERALDTLYKGKPARRVLIDAGADDELTVRKATDEQRGSEESKISRLRIGREVEGAAVNSSISKKKIVSTENRSGDDRDSLQASRQKDATESSTSIDHLLLKDRRVQEEISDELVELALSIKESASSVRHRLSVDSERWNEMRAKIDTNTFLSGKASSTLGGLIRYQRTSMWTYWMIILFAMIAFIFTYLFMKIVPKPK